MKAVRAAVLAVSAVLLTSIGGAAIVAAPVTLPALWLVARHSGRLGRALALLVAAATAAEVAWAAAYLGAGEESPMIWALPVSAACLMAVAFALSTRSPA